jgi:hypothetical protein
MVVTSPPVLAELEALECAHSNHIAFFEAAVAPDLARLEADHGNLDDGLILFDEALDAAHRGGSHTQLSIALASLAFVFLHLGRVKIAATIYGSSTRSPGIANVPSLPEVIEQLRDGLGAAAFGDCVTTGAAMDTAAAVRYARQQIRSARDVGDGPTADAATNHGRSPIGEPPSRIDTGVATPCAAEETPW